MAILKVKNRRGSWKEIDSKDFNGKPYGEFTKYIRQHYDILYGVDNEEEIHTVELEVMGTKTETYTGHVTVQVQTEDQIHDQILDSNIEWDSFSSDETDLEWDGDWEIESIDNGFTKMKRDSFGNVYFTENKHNKNQLQFNFEKSEKM